MSDELLDMDLRLLLLRYGRERVLRGLTRLSDQNIEQVKQQLNAIVQKKSKPKNKKAPPTIFDLVTTAADERPDILEPLRTLAIQFENRNFLPQLRDVERFLDRMGEQHGKLKSRNAAASAVVRVLARLGREELFKLSAHEKGQGDSDFSLLANAIMRPAKKEHD